MNWSDLKKMEKDTIESKDLNLFEKVIGVIVVPIAIAVIKADEAIEDATGKGLVDRCAESIEKEEEEKKKHYWKWAGKKLLKGTITGVFGASIHSKS